jgi:SAM-dependent methyltransferase
MDLKEIEILGEGVAEHWYYNSKARAMMRLLKGKPSHRVLDVGSGSGFFARHLLSKSNLEEAWCIDPGYESESDGLENGKPIHFRRAIEVADSDVVLLMDVLEHVDDDEGLLREYVKKVPSGARFLITVPAFGALWSGHDDFLGHRRRYTVKHLEGVVERSGLRVETGCYYFGLVLPLAAVTRLAQKVSGRGRAPKSQMTRHSAPINTFLSWLCRAELPILRANRLAGLSVCCVAVKP